MFIECSSAFEDGRVQSNPADKWYLTELEFFDKHIIPLAKKLQYSFKLLGKEKMGEEFLVCALKNSEEWRDKGTKIVSELIEMVQKSRQ